ncbi:hypothetical protein D9M68_921570 [compost metagenome]
MARLVSKVSLRKITMSYALVVSKYDGCAALVASARCRSRIGAPASWRTFSRQASGAAVTSSVEKSAQTNSAAALPPRKLLASASEASGCTWLAEKPSSSIGA